MVKRISLGHISVDEYTTELLVEDLLDRAFNSVTANILATLNAQFYVLAAKDKSFQNCLERSDFLCADGQSICFACRWLSGTTIERISGVDLILRLCEQGAPQGLRVAFLGGKPGAAHDTASKLKATYEGLIIAGIFCPEYGFETDPIVLKSLLEDVSRFTPHIVFVGLGAPKQEIFMDRHLRKLNIPVSIGVGGSFELLSGRLKRAPVWMRRSGLEWLFRLLQEPRRLWRRYCIGNVEFLWIVFGNYCNMRLKQDLRLFLTKLFRQKKRSVRRGSSDVSAFVSSDSVVVDDETDRKLV